MLNNKQSPIADTEIEDFLANKTLIIVGEISERA
jgi:hypothetical protein